MVGNGQSIRHRASTGSDFKFCQSCLQGIVGYRDSSGVLDCCDSSRSYEDIYQGQGSKEPWLGGL